MRGRLTAWTAEALLCAVPKASAVRLTLAEIKERKMSDKKLVDIINSCLKVDEMASTLYTALSE